MLKEPAVSLPASKLVHSGKGKEKDVPDKDTNI